MNYYEELGLRRESTAPEIRQAYRVAARLVHPIRHVDELVRDIGRTPDEAAE
jgi:curved DNA-binding protein CbpA